MVTQITGNTLEELAIKTKKFCANNHVENLHLTGVFNIEEINSNFIEINTEKAKQWEEKKCPINLYINHGEFIHKKISGVEFILAELKKKKYSNRACISLLDMETIINSKDNPIPSFLIMQFGFSKKNDKSLLVTLYYRALEVSHFLPTNLAECCIYISEIRKHFPDILQFELNLHAFRAQSIPNFHCLEKAEIDYISPIIIADIVYKQDLDKIKGLIYDKLIKVESVIQTKGLGYLNEALATSTEFAKFKKTSDILSDVIKTMYEVKEIRENTSYYEDVESHMDILKKQLTRIIKEIESIK